MSEPQLKARRYSKPDTETTPAYETGIILIILLSLTINDFWGVGFFGAIILAAASISKRKYICSNCGNRLEKTSKICPCCGATLSK